MANKLIESYLDLLNEGNNSNDPSIPNPYDYQSIELDPDVRKEDFNKLGQWLQQNKKMLDPDMNLDPYKWIYCGIRTANFEDCVERLKEDTIPYTIIDKGKRVGIVSMDVFGQLKWSSWVSGYNYSLRGTMKMLERIVEGNHPWSKTWRKWHGVETTIHYKNIASLKTSMKLKMKCEKEGDYYNCELGQPFWWIEKKKR